MTREKGRQIRFIGTSLAIWHLRKLLFGVGLKVAVRFSVWSSIAAPSVCIFPTFDPSWLIGFRSFRGFDLRFSGGGSWQQLQPHNLFVAGQAVDQVGQANGRDVAPPPNVTQVESFHRLAHVAKDVFDASANLGPLAIAFFLLAAQRAVAESQRLSRRVSFHCAHRKHRSLPRPFLSQLSRTFYPVSRGAHLHMFLDRDSNLKRRKYYAVFCFA
jgi:hypothetical protein